MNSPLGWHPVAAAQDLRAGRGVLAARLLGQPLALWRSADGQPQAWEDRCPHRGVRLSLGRVLGNHLACAYHGWEYAAGSGRCVAIPAMPNDPVPGNVCARTYPVREMQSMVWVALETLADSGSMRGDLAAVAGASTVPSGRPLRALAVHTSLDSVDAALTREGFLPRGQSRWDARLADTAICIYTQQADAALVMLHCRMAHPGGDYAPPALFAQLRRLRSTIEQGVS